MRVIHGLTKGASALVLAAAASVAGIASAPAPASAALPSECTAQSTTSVVCTYNYNGTDGTDGTVQTFVVPRNVGAATIEAWGAQGAGPDGGLGGYIKGTVGVTPGAVLEVRVGGNPTAAAGGYNGGGNGGTGSFGGGGGSDVRVTGADIVDRLVTAGGGGGSGRGTSAGSPLAYRGGSGGYFATGGSLVSGPPSLDCNLPFGGSTFCGGRADPLFGGAAAYNQACAGTVATGGTYGVGGNGTTCTADVDGVTVALAGAGGGGGWTGGGGGGVWITSDPTVVRSGPGAGGTSRIRVAQSDTAESVGVRSGHGAVTISYNPRGVPASGYLNCHTTNGTLKTSPPLTNTPSTKPVKMTFTVNTACDSDNVIGGKAPITDVVYTQTWTAATGSTCDSIPSGVAPKSQKVQAKLKGRNAQDRLFTVATIRTTAHSVRAFSTGFDSRGTVPSGDRTAFANHEIRLSTYADPIESLAAQCAGTGLATSPFTGFVIVRTVDPG